MLIFKLCIKLGRWRSWLMSSTGPRKKIRPTHARRERGCIPGVVPCTYQAEPEGPSKLIPLVCTYPSKVSVKSKPRASSLLRRKQSRSAVAVSSRLERVVLEVVLSPFSVPLYDLAKLALPSRLPNRGRRGSWTRCRSPWV